MRHNQGGFTYHGPLTAHFAMPAYYSATVTAHMPFGDHVEYIIQVLYCVRLEYIARSYSDGMLLLKVVQEGSTWNVRHRYSEFHTLHNNLLRDYNTKATLPPKQWLNRSNLFMFV